jgi:hypothetical protein
MPFSKPSPCLVFLALAAGVLIAASPARADEIDDILSQSEVELQLNKGVARGNIVGCKEGKILFKRGPVEFQVPVEDVQQDVAVFVQSAKRLADEKHFGRAAVQIGIARTLAPNNPQLPQLVEIAISGLALENARLIENRSAREASEEDEFRKEAMRKFSNKFPDLHRLYSDEPPRLPRAIVAAPPEMGSWIDFQRFGGGMGQTFEKSREGRGDVWKRLSAMQSVASSLPPLTKISETAQDEKLRGIAAVNFFLMAASGLWVDQLEFSNYRTEHQNEVMSFTPPIVKAEELARDLLLEKLVPSYEMQEKKTGNQTEQIRVEIPRDPNVVERMKYRIEAPFVGKTRMGRGMRFITSEGDWVIVPVYDWETFDNPPMPPATPEEGFVETARPGMGQFRKSLSELVVAWGQTGGANELEESLARLESEAKAVLRAEPQAASQPAQ